MTGPRSHTTEWKGRSQTQSQKIQSVDQLCSPASLLSTWNLKLQVAGAVSRIGAPL